MLVSLPFKEDRMQHYLRYEKGITPAGAIVVRFFHSGDEVRASVRQVTAETTDDAVFPSDGLEPSVALRMAINEQQSHPGATVYVELTEGIEWNADWDDVEAPASPVREP
jgi:hypothetical protein